MDPAVSLVPDTEIVRLDNCDREPIHIPGSIQPHGALLAFTPDGRLVSSSANASDLVGAIPAPGEVLSEQHLDQRTRDAIAAKLAGSDKFPQSLTIRRGDETLDLIMHKSEDLLIVELENRLHNSPPLDEYAHMAAQVIDHLYHAAGIADMMQTAAEEVRRLTGFDRVMAYQFLYDDSGEVVGESRRDSMAPMLGQRFPASDIPAQARRLYIVNPIRLIADARYQPLPLLPDHNPLTGRQIDLSHSVLRSVSPIHLEYLHNMGIRASMSISIIVQGRLWGMLGCHHETPRLVPHAIRLSCVVLSRIVSAMAERFEAEAHARAVEEAVALRQHVVDTAGNARELHLAFGEANSEIARLLRADGCAMAVEGKLVSYGDVPSSAHIAALIDWMAVHRDQDLFQTNSLVNEMPPFAGAPSGWPESICGVMAIRFDREQKGYLIWFRNEQVESVHWAGEPVKKYAEGPDGPRLAPRGSFALWKKEVHGKSIPWSSGQLEIARKLRIDFQEIAFAKSTRLRLNRERLWATLGHDLRVPLQAIMVCAGRLQIEAEHTENAKTTGIINRITAASHRMSRLVSEVMDISKLQSGMSLSLDLLQIDCNKLIADMVDETMLAFPHAKLIFNAEGDGVIMADADRLSQVLTNLISNAVNHGEPGCPITIVSTKAEHRLKIVVSNFADMLSDELLTDIFSPYKSGTGSGGRNKNGLGLGLHIAREIIQGHGGDISVSQTAGIVSFQILLPVGGQFGGG